MTTLNTGVTVGGGEGSSFAPCKAHFQINENEILSSKRIKQRRATVAPTDIPAGQLPRYLRDAGRYNNNRRQSMPVGHFNPNERASGLPATIPIQIKPYIKEVDKIDKDSNKPTDVRGKVDQSKGQYVSFPLDNRLRSNDHHRNGLGSIQEINNCSVKCQDRKIPQVRELKKTQSEKELEIIWNCEPPVPKFLNLEQTRNTSLKVASPENFRRHSIAVSVLKDSKRGRSESPLPGMTDLGEFENALYSSRDRSMSVVGDKTKNWKPERKMGTYIPKPDNHLLLSIFSCMCCCPLLGIVALILSLQVDLKYENGKKEESVTKSKTARCWALTAVMFGMLTILGASMYFLIVLAILPQGNNP